jgi:hypothetical protein
MNTAFDLNRTCRQLVSFSVMILAAAAVTACCFIPGFHPIPGGTGTNLVVKNNTDSPVPVLITLGAGYGINSVTQLPASWHITPHPDGTNLKGSFTLPANSSVAFNSGANSFSGNVAFGPTFAAMGCGGSACYPNATNLAEFTLNYPGETVDISCVNGVNAFISYQLSGGATWTDNVSPAAVSSFANKAMGQNANIPGVYGWQATTCTGNPNPPNPTADCPAPNDAPGASELSSAESCNVQRKGDAPFGGTVTIIFNGWTPNSEPPANCAE